MELVLMIGVQGSGKSTFCEQMFRKSHLILSRDVLRTKYRQRKLLEVCLETQMPVVIDNTNPTVDNRAPFLLAAAEHGFHVRGFYMKSSLQECLERNASRKDAERIPDVGIRATYSKMQLPTGDEGFGELLYVTQEAGFCFCVKPWKDDEI